MTNESSVLPRPAQAARPDALLAATPTSRVLLWSVRRELWEHRVLWLAPSVTAGIIFALFVLIMAVMARPGVVPALPYEVAPNFVVVAMALVWIFYGVDALHGERRDRSILFWKSLPVSDLTTVLSKAAIMLVVLPALSFVILAGLQVALWLSGRVIGLMVGLPLDRPGPFPLLRTLGTLLYGIATMTLWLAPVHAWLLLVSAWARRAVLVWALLPFVALRVLQQVSGLSGPLSKLTDRWVGWSEAAFLPTPRPPLVIDPMAAAAPAKFVGSPGLWIGLAVAALLLYAAAHVRRRRVPL